MGGAGQLSKVSDLSTQHHAASLGKARKGTGPLRVPEIAGYSKIDGITCAQSIG